MEWELPILIVAKDDFLNKLQMGEVYMKNSIYYQQMEDDEQHGDKYDGAIPSNLFSLKGVTNGRITMMPTYIKSFFQYKPQNVKMLSESQLAFYIPDNSAISLKELSETTEGNALLIWNTEEFISRFAKKCNELKIKYYFGPVEYINDSEYPNCEAMLIQAFYKQKDGAPNPIFIKRKLYESQQEFRIAVMLNIGEPPHNATGIKIPESISFSIDGIKDISVIVKLNDMVEKSVFARITTLGKKKGAKIEYYL